MRLSDQDKVGIKILTGGYFEFIAIFAQRMMANGKENPVIHIIFSHKIKSLGSCSGRKLILTIFPPSSL
jgi:hypothetical protein